MSLVWIAVLVFFGRVLPGSAAASAAPQSAGRAARRRRWRRSGRADRGDGAEGEHRRLCRRHRHGDAGVYGFDHQPGERDCDGGALTPKDSWCTKGDPLIEIDPRPYQATLMQAQGTLERDQDVLAQAQMDLARYQAAWARNAIQKQTLDDQEKLVEQDQGTVKNDQGTVQYDQIQVEFCHIMAPITGRVGLRLVDPGNVVQANGTTVLAVVTQIQPITVVFTVAEDSLGQIAAADCGKRAKLTVDAFDRTGLKKIAQGTLLTLDNQIDTTTGTVKARASFANKDSSLFPNQFVNTRLLVNTLHGVTLIPTAAVQHNGQAAFVYVIDRTTRRTCRRSRWA